MRSHRRRLVRLENVGLGLQGRWATLTYESCLGTQEDQNKQDEEARNKAMKELVMSWMERLQLISVIVSTLIGEQTI